MNEDLKLKDWLNENRARGTRFLQRLVQEKVRVETRVVHKQLLLKNAVN